MRRNTSARLRLVCAAVLLTAVLAGFTPPAQAARPHASPVAITIWTAYTKGLSATLAQLIHNFEQKYPGITVTHVSAVDYNTLLQKEESAIFAGNPPTLGQAYEAWVEQFTRSHAVQDLSPYIDGKNGLSREQIGDYFTSEWNDGVLHGTRYMMPFSKSDIVLYYNPALLKRSGITAPPATWDQFAADCARLTKIENGRASQWGATLQVDEADWYAWEYEWGNQVLDAHNKAAFATSKGAAPVAFFANLAKHKYIVVSTTQNYQDQADFDAGKTAFDISTSAGLSYVLAAAEPGVQVSVAPFPAGPVRQATEMYGAPLVIFSKAPEAQKQAAWTFLKWLTEPAQTAYWSIQTGYMPVRRSALDLPEMRAYYKKYPTRKASVEELNNAIIEPSLNGWPKAQNDLQTVLLAALTGSKSPLEAMRQAAQQVDADLSAH